MPTGEVGKLMIKGPIIMTGHYGNEMATRETIEPNAKDRTQSLPVCPPQKQRHNPMRATSLTVVLLLSYIFAVVAAWAVDENTGMGPRRPR
jgi:hypothetical protein